VHYPTDINLLLDAMRKVIFLTHDLSEQSGIDGWRKSKYNYNKIRRLYRKCQKSHRSKKKEKKDRVKAFESYMAVAAEFLERAEETISQVTPYDEIILIQILEIEQYINDARRQIDQIERRIINGETIPHEEKVFSIFERHTEWISKGKAGVPVELGLQVCIMEDENGFILHHRVMQKEEDVDVAVAMVKATLEKFPEFDGCSFDKGFWCPENQTALSRLLNWLVLPKKGKRSRADKEREGNESFAEGRRKHSAVESAIAALENQGLDRCLDHGVAGFENYVALAVLGRNFQKLGGVLQAKALKRARRKRPNGGGLKKAA